MCKKTPIAEFNRRRNYQFPPTNHHKSTSDPSSQPHKVKSMVEQYRYRVAVVAAILLLQILTLVISSPTNGILNDVLGEEEGKQKQKKNKSEAQEENKPKDKDEGLISPSVGGTNINKPISRVGPLDKMLSAKGPLDKVTSIGSTISAPQNETPATNTTGDGNQKAIGPIRNPIIDSDVGGAVKL